MELQVGPHLEELELEQYSMGQLPNERLEAFEEHFLACDACQDRLLEMEAYVNAMCSVSPKVRAAQPSLGAQFWKDLWRWPRPAWTAAFALSVMALGAGVWILAPPRRVEMAMVVLQAARGSGGAMAATAPAGKPLSLKMDLTELAAFSSYRLEVVDASGIAVWTAMAPARDGQIAQPIEKALKPGQYYVRLYSPQGGLLREFSLRAE